MPFGTLENRFQAFRKLLLKNFKSLKGAFPLFAIVEGDGCRRSKVEELFFIL